MASRKLTVRFPLFTLQSTAGILGSGKAIPVFYSKSDARNMLENWSIEGEVVRFNDALTFRTFVRRVRDMGSHLLILPWQNRGEMLGRPVRCTRLLEQFLFEPQFPYSFPLFTLQLPTGGYLLLGCTLPTGQQHYLLVVFSDVGLAERAAAAWLTPCRAVPFMTAQALANSIRALSPAVGGAMFDPPLPKDRGRVDKPWIFRDDLLASLESGRQGDPAAGNRPVTFETIAPKDFALRYPLFALRSGAGYLVHNMAECGLPSPAPGVLLFTSAANAERYAAHAGWDGAFEAIGSDAVLKIFLSGFQDPDTILLFDLLPGEDGALHTTCALAAASVRERFLSWTEFVGSYPVFVLRSGDQFRGVTGASPSGDEHTLLAVFTDADLADRAATTWAAPDAPLAFHSERAFADWLRGLPAEVTGVTFDPPDPKLGRGLGRHCVSRADLMAAADFRAEERR